MEFIYRPEILIELAQTYLYADNDYWQFVHKHSPAGQLQFTTIAAERDYLVKEREAALTLDALRHACRMVGAVLATAKAMKRYEKRELWQIREQRPCGDSARRFFAKANVNIGHPRDRVAYVASDLILSCGHSGSMVSVTHSTKRRGEQNGHGQRKTIGA